MISVFDLFSVGIGPSSSHTVGPMRAARTFVTGLKADGLLHTVTRVRAELFGSLGATGHGHGSDRAVLLGLAGESPETVDTDSVGARVAEIRDRRRLALLGTQEIDFEPDRDLVLHRRRSLPYHPNGMVFSAWDAAGRRCAPGRTTRSVVGSWSTRRRPGRTGSRRTPPPCGTPSRPVPNCSASPPAPACRSAR